IGTVALSTLAPWREGQVPPLVVLALALAAWSAARRALAVQGLHGHWPDAIGLGLGLAAIAVTAGGPVPALALGFVAGLLLALAAARILPERDLAEVDAQVGPYPTLVDELVAVHQALVFTA